MGQDLMNWTMPAGSLFEEDGSRARDRRHAGAAREERAQHAERSLLSRAAAITAFAGFASLARSGGPVTQNVECCTAA